MAVKGLGSEERNKRRYVFNVNLIFTYANEIHLTINFSFSILNLLW